MTSTTKSALSYRRATCRRVLGYLLLIIIAYGASVESLHSHGLFAPVHIDAAAISDASGSNSSLMGRSHEIECSMCAFQQQLFNGLAHAPLCALTPSAQMAFVATLTAFGSSASITSPPERGPPLSSV